MSYRYQHPHHHPYRYFQQNHQQHRIRRPRSHSPTPRNFCKQFSPTYNHRFNRSKSPTYQRWNEQRMSSDQFRKQRYGNSGQFHFGDKKESSNGVKQTTFDKDYTFAKTSSSPTKTQRLSRENSDVRSVETHRSEPSPTIVPPLTVEGGNHVKLCVQEAKALFHSDCLTISEVVQLLINEDAGLEDRLVSAMTKCLNKLMESHLQHLRLAKQLHSSASK